MRCTCYKIDMIKNTPHQQASGCLSDKDIQLVRKTYLKLTEIYYENPKNESIIQSLINMGDLITQVITVKRQSDVLSLIPIAESLKVKSKSRPDILEHIDRTVNHLRTPVQNPIKYETLLYCLQQSDLFSVGCTVTIRFYQKIQGSGSEFNWRQIIEQLSRNITINPTLCIELSYLICVESQSYSHCAVKSGLIKYVFLSYIGSTLENKFNLYKAIKLLKVIAKAEPTLLRQKQKPLALVIYTYEDYVPVIEGIISKCYDPDYCQAIDNKCRYDLNTLDQPYLWSYLETFCLNNLSEPTVKELIKRLKEELNEVLETKIYGILFNYSKYKKLILKEVLQLLPKSEKALLNFIKLCVNCCELDHGSSNIINMVKIQELVDKSLNPKVDNLFKYLKQLRNKEQKIGILSENYKKMFDMEKNADFMLERAARVPQNNDQLADIRQILKQKDRSNEFQSDTLQTVKERALQSLHTAIMQKKKLDLNTILKEVDLGDVAILVRLLQILQLCLTMNEELIQFIDINRLLEIIQWIENNYNGQLIDWSSISQLLIILIEDGQWKKHIKEIPDKCFWLLSVQVLSEQEQTLLYDRIEAIQAQIGKYQHKVPLMLGFISRLLLPDSRLMLYNRFNRLFSIMTDGLKNSSHHAYKANVLMYAAFVRKWYSEDEADQKINIAFQKEIIPGLVKIVLNNFRFLDQQYGFFENCLPYKVECDGLRDNIEHLVGLYGKLASFIYKSCLQNWQKRAISYDRIKAIGLLPLQKNRNMVQILRFLEQNSELLQADELSIMLDNLIANKFAYWFAYPNFYNLITLPLSIIAKTTNPVLLAKISSILYKIIIYIIHYSDLSNDEQNDILAQIKDCLGFLSNRHVPIDKNKLKDAVGKIPNKEIKEQIIEILTNYQIIEPQSQYPSDKGQNDGSKQKRDNKEESNALVSDIISNLGPSEFSENESMGPGSLPAEVNLQDIETYDAQSQHQIKLVQALRILKKIIEKKEDVQKFTVLYTVFQRRQIASQYKDILGHLLALFYPNRSSQIKQKVLELLLNKEKTRISKETCFQLLKNNPQAFCLSKRWKLVGRQWLDLAMLRYSEGQVADASQVAEANIASTAELDYFFSKGYHQILSKKYQHISQEEDHAYNLLLIGTSARNSHIKVKYYKQKIHTKIICLVNQFPNNAKLFANLLYALSSMVYMQPEVCLEVIKHKDELQVILNRLKEQEQNRSIIQSGACLVANLSYSNEEVKEVLRHLNVIEIFLFLFEASLPSTNISTFKQILRAFGNLSLSSKCTQELIDHHFCWLAVQMTQKLDVFVSLDDSKMSLMKILIDLIANLASHRYRLEVFHRQKVTHVMLKLLQTTQTHLPILTACIDTIDCLCQSSQIQNYVVTQKNIPYLLIDILKIQTDQKIVVKSTRLLTNLTINPACIPHILKANLLSVLANIVMPHFYGNRMATQQNKKMETYILKVLTRIYNSKPDKEVIIKSGYLDCLIRTLETADNIEESYIEILYFYSEIMPNFLNKRAFICLIKVLTRKINVKQITTKCLRAIKKLSAFYEKDQEDMLPTGTSEVYEKLLTSDVKDEGLELLLYHLLRSAKLRQLLRGGQSKVLEFVKKIGQNSEYVDLSRQITFLVYNPYVGFEESSEIKHEEQYEQLKKGFKCLLFRIDGSSKKAVIDMNDEYQIRAYKFPDGEIKKKYVIDIRNIKDFQFNYSESDQLWRSTVFSFEKGLFDSKKCQPRNCCTLISSKNWGEISFVNVEFESEAQKIRFYVCLRSIYNILR